MTTNTGVGFLRVELNDEFANPVDSRIVDGIGSESMQPDGPGIYFLDLELRSVKLGALRPC